MKENKASSWLQTPQLLSNPLAHVPHPLPLLSGVQLDWKHHRCATVIGDISANGDKVLTLSIRKFIFLSHIPEPTPFIKQCAFWYNSPSPFCFSIVWQMTSVETLYSLCRVWYMKQSWCYEGVSYCLWINLLDARLHTLIKWLIRLIKYSDCKIYMPPLIKYKIKSPCSPVPSLRFTAFFPSLCKHPLVSSFYINHFEALFA